MPPTPTPTPDYSTAHAQFFKEKLRQYGQPLVVDVTGEGVPEHIYASADCASCSVRFITVFSGPNSIFDDDGYLLPVVEVLPDHTGFAITEKVVLQGETIDTASGRIVWTFRYNGSRFSFVNKEETRVAATPPTPLPPPAGGSVPYAPTQSPAETLRITLLYQIDSYEREVFGPYAPSDRKNGDWRPFNLKMEAWLPQHPEFRRYYAWLYQQYGRSTLWRTVYLNPRIMRLAETLDKYLAEQR